MVAQLTSGSGNPSFVAVTNLRKAYGDNLAVAGVNLRIPSGICYGLLGPNGAGKSTTISILAGTLEADSGEVSLEGARIGVGELRVKERIGYVPQELALYEDLTVLANMKFFGVLYGLSGVELDSRISSVLEIVGLQDRKKDIVRTFSGGMKRRLNIAGALLHDPDFLILDEPTVGVDPQSRNLIFEALEVLVSKGKTLLYTTHYMEELERLCTRVAIMDGGKVIAEGTQDDLYRLAPVDNLVQIQLRTPLEILFDEQPGLVSIQFDEPCLTLELEDLTTHLPGCLDLIRKKGGTIENIATQRPTLETVFLHLTGRALRD